MGRQVNFFMSAHDLANFMDVVGQDEPYEVLPDSALRPTPAPIDVKWGEKPGAEGLRVYLVQDRFISEIKYRENAATGRFYLDPEQTTVMELTRCYEDGEIIRRGRLYFTTSYYGSAGSSVEKPAEFVAWGSRLLRKLKKLYPNRMGTWVLGNHAKQLAAGGIVLKSL